MDVQKKPSKLTIVLIVLLIIALVVVLMLFLKGRGPSEIGGGEPIPNEQNVPKAEGVTHLPSYGSLTFKAGTKEQTAVMQNPGENSCLVRITLTLADGTEIYESELVEPGYYTKPITLVAPMKRGIYRDVVLEYECFSDDESQIPMNGATTTLDITVK